MGVSGSNDYSKESETSGGSERVKPLSARKLDMDFEGDVVGSQPSGCSSPESVEGLCLYFEFLFAENPMESME